MKNPIVFLLFLFVLPISLLSNKALSEDKVEYFKKPLREYSVILTESGYFPNRLVANEGEKVRFFITSTLDKPDCFIVQDHKVFLSAKKGEISETETVFSTPGKFKFFCPSSKHAGYITVLEKHKIQAREVASEKPNYWLPRDYD